MKACLPTNQCTVPENTKLLLEFLALKWAITDKFHEYLYGSEFQVFTDNNPLTYVLTTAKLDATGHRWVAALSNYNFSITYKPGKGHVDADALSCIKWPEAIDIDSQTGGTGPTWQGGNHYAKGPKQWMHCVKTMPHQA